MIMNQSRGVVKYGERFPLRKGGVESKTFEECEEHDPDIAQMIRYVLKSQGKVISANCLLIYL